MPLPDETEPGTFELDLAVAIAGHEALLKRFDELGDDPLDAFLRHVGETVPYYRDRVMTLAELPLVDRETMRADRSSFLSSTHAGDVEGLWARTNGTLGPRLEAGFDLAGYYELFHFFFARVCAAREGLRASLVPGEIGIHYVHDVPYDVRLTAYEPALGGVLLRRWPMGRAGDEDAQTVHELRAAAPRILYGKVPLLLRLARLDAALAPTTERIRPGVLLMSGAPLYPRDRRDLEAWFGCGIINAYATTEGGLIAIECERALGFHVLDDRVVVEVLRDDGSVATEGSGEVVITNVMNWAHAFVRYRLGDRATVASSCPCGHDGPTLVELGSRDVVAYDVDGLGRVEASALATILERDEIRQYEVAQPEPGTLLIRWIPRDGADLDAELESALRALLGAHLDLRRVDQITVTGGKGLRFVREPRFPEPA